jgi:hypothetical protein
MSFRRSDNLRVLSRYKLIGNDKLRVFSADQDFSGGKRESLIFAVLRFP